MFALVFTLVALYMWYTYQDVKPKIFYTNVEVDAQIDAGISEIRNFVRSQFSDKNKFILEQLRFTSNEVRAITFAEDETTKTEIKKVPPGTTGMSLDNVLQEDFDQIKIFKTPGIIHINYIDERLRFGSQGSFTQRFFARVFLRVKIDGTPSDLVTMITASWEDEKIPTVNAATVFEISYAEVNQYNGELYETTPVPIPPNSKKIEITEVENLVVVGKVEDRKEEGYAIRLDLTFTSKPKFNLS